MTLCVFEALCEKKIRKAEPVPIPVPDIEAYAKKLKIQRCQLFAGQCHQIYTVAANDGEGGGLVPGNCDGAWIQVDAILNFF